MKAETLLTKENNIYYNGKQISINSEKLTFVEKLMGENPDVSDLVKSKNDYEHWNTSHLISTL